MPGFFFSSVVCRLTCSERCSNEPYVPHLDSTLGLPLAISYLPQTHPQMLGAESPPSPLLPQNHDGLLQQFLLGVLANLRAWGFL